MPRSDAWTMIKTNASGIMQITQHRDQSTVLKQEVGLIYNSLILQTIRVSALLENTVEAHLLSSA